jgi:hypothetical protein
MAMEDINSGKLKFIGRDRLPGFDKNSSCVFENEHAYVIYNNCMANRKEAPALDIEVISKNGGKTSMYYEPESNCSDKNISTIPRANFCGTWTVEFAPSSPPGKLNMNSLKNYLNGFSSAEQGGCYVGAPFEANIPKGTEPKSVCRGSLSGTNIPEWITAATAFWKDPGPTWQPTQAKLRELVETAPY